MEDSLEARLPGRLCALLARQRLLRGEPFVGDFVGATGAPVALARVGGTTIVGSAKLRCDGEKSKFCRYSARLVTCL